MQSPRFSVVLPTYNRATRLKPAIRSVIDQTFEDWELVIVDDGSTDNTSEVVSSFANPKIRYYKTQHQENISKVRNLGNSVAVGEIIVVQDSDDLSFPDRLEKIHEGFVMWPNTDVLYHGMYMTYPDPYYGVTRRVRPAADYDKERLLTEQYIPGQIAYTKKIWEKIPYNEQITLCDDYMFLLELALNDAKFSALHLNLYEYMTYFDSVNINGEMDGRRRTDVIEMLKILREKYGIDAHATLSKQVSGEVISKEDI